MDKYPKNLQILFTFLRKLPGVGQKTAERFAFQLLQWDQNDLSRFGEALLEIKKKILTCEECGALTEEQCHFCEGDRDKKIICIISSPRDIFLIESTRSYKGLYHVIPHLLSPIDGKFPEDLRLSELKKRVLAHECEEVIIALDSTIEGDTTSLFLKQQLDEWGVKSSRLAFGLPVGSSLEYTDEGTLARALIGRQVL